RMSTVAEAATTIAHRSASDPITPEPLTARAVSSEVSAALATGAMNTKRRKPADRSGLLRHRVSGTSAMFLRERASTPILDGVSSRAGGCLRPRDEMRDLYRLVRAGGCPPGPGSHSLLPAKTGRVGPKALEFVV